MKKLFVVIIFILLALNNFAQDLNGWKLSGQVQLRSEVDGRDFSNRTHPLTFTSLRTRLGGEKTFADKVNFFVQFQDSRVFGEEGSPTTYTANVDLYQGYIKLIKPFDLDFNVQAGRFAMVYGTERFFGASNWSYIGRSFDGVLFSVMPDCWNLDLFALTLNESVSYINNPSPTLYPYPQQETPSQSIYGFYKKNKITDASKFDLVGYYEIDRTDVLPDTNAIELLTIGGTYWGSYGDFSTVVEAAYQLGNRGVRDVNAYMFSLSGNYKTGITTIGLGADILSGNDPNKPDKANAYLPSYGTNHKFYGYMDYFPSNAFGLGLNDFYFKTSINPTDSKFSFAADVHHFMSNQETSDGKSTLGQEIDLTVIYKFAQGTNITWGGSLFFPGDIMKVLYSPREDAAFWTYLMITANL
ncbi:MAG: alginate export family protein [Ignavibacterium album]|uniref:alginate export family protein n=1 Tax=Ignavibacterium album TaxID=591197 RepID=UPI0026ECD5C5|nr:alginate export family protein [Ignavibacterium album]MCX8106403.1 alginate export family protein [Ignavibacterium album]